MNPESIREYALSKEGAEESFPFGEETLVFKVNGKIFLLLSLDETPSRFNAKCDPDKVPELREEYPDHILPGYHMNKKHWNTIVLDGQLPPRLVKKIIDDSYDLVNSKKKK
ncbi:MAG: MmcQ/YjbR family DNA-binding protein [Ferruginibacter sp.]